MRLNYSFKPAGWILIPFSVFILISLFSCPSTYAEDSLYKIRNLITNQDSVILASPDGKILCSVHGDKQLIPASTLKILTSLIAIHYLKTDHRFATDFFIDNESNLIIKGYGDPLLISEEIEKIAAALSQNTEIIHDIILDDTFFDKPLIMPGTVEGSLQPYDAPNGALCVNFNTVNFKIKDQKIFSAEPQTPVVDIARQKIERSRLNSGRILLTNDANEITLYAGQIFGYFFQAAGIEMQGKIRLGKVNPEEAELIYRHVSPYRLTDIIARLLEYSNNFMANQLLLAAGAQAYGPPASMEKGVRAAKKYLAEQFMNKEIDTKEISFVEGSGISRKNNITARAFLEILSEFRPYHALMPHDAEEYFKTGTLNGIATRAGYLISETKALYPFVVLVNTPGKSTGPIMNELKKLIQ
jgi:D-alanyl-D-alanine carboxypeptidase/D-alanyl-D-alanine-endopeptidase (penicillin-binding protein 4)